MKEFDPESLKEFNGNDGKPVYVAYKGRVIDVTNSKFWKTGVHMKRHPSGTDLTADIEAAPHGLDVLDRYPQAGILKAKEESTRLMPEWLAGLLDRIPLLRRHPHPMVVHFPIVFLMAAAGFTFLFLLTGNLSFEFTAWYCLWGGVLFAVPAIATGLFTWWINYDAQFLPQVTIKLTLSPLVLLLGTATLIWRYLDPAILTVWKPVSYLYLGCVLALAVLVSAIGWFGGTLSFPLEGE